MAPRGAHGEHRGFAAEVLQLFVCGGGANLFKLRLLAMQFTQLRGHQRRHIHVGCEGRLTLGMGRGAARREFRSFGFFKRVRGTEFAWWDTRVYSPLCIAISAGYALLWSFAR